MTQNSNSSLEYEEFEQTGPYEPITTRLRNILKEYKEGIGVFKELIQNADDAGASTVRFLVDWRRGPRATLLGPNMASCQGPALWAYNDAVFTQKDFENINKVAGETKVSEFDKIGQFGLGFNAVYHVTDVPSFVSGECCVIFDPNVTHLENCIRDKSRPGIRINFRRKPETLMKFRDQFQPYDRIFGCRTQEGTGTQFHYDGTLFRFPFRTQSEAEQNEICQTVYDKKKIEELTKSLKECASLLLLFLPHVKVVELYELSGDSGSPDEMQLVLSVSKSDLHENNETFINECGKWWNSMLSVLPLSGNGPSRSGLFFIETKVDVSDLISSTERSVKEEWWLVASCVGTGSSVQLARTKEGRAQGLLPCASAAVQLEKVDTRPPNSFRVASTMLAGEAFCFLPLSIPTGLPVHVNAYFAIMSNRMEIWKRDTSSAKQPIEVQWNESLLQDALANAYLELLEAAKARVLNGVLGSSYEFHSFWPGYNDLTTTTWQILVKTVYQLLVRGSLPLFHSNNKWISINDGWVLCDQIFRHDSRQHFVDILTQLGQPVFLLPPAVLESLRKTGNENVLSRQTLSLKRFLNDFLLPNITKISSKNRDTVICFALDYIVDYLDISSEDEAGGVVSLLKSQPCITVSKNGGHVEKPCRLINPNGVSAKLFSEEDRRFPVGKHFLTNNRMYVLERLGMVRDKLPWQEIVERAKTVDCLGLEKGQERARDIINYMKHNNDNYKEEPKLKEALRCTPFLPFLSEPPRDYCLQWEGSSQRKRFATPEELFLLHNQDLVGSSYLILDESTEHGCGTLNQSVRHLLGFSDRNPEIQLVLLQLDEAIRTWRQMSDKDKDQKKSKIESVCQSVYKYFEKLAKDVAESDQRRKSPDVPFSKCPKKPFHNLLKELSQKPRLFIQGQFVASELVAENWSGNAAPFLYGLPYEYRRDYHNLFRAVGIRKSFTPVDFLTALYKLSKSTSGRALTDDELKTAVTLLGELKGIDGDEFRDDIGRIPLPDSEKVLYRSDELTINLTPWLQDNGSVRTVHPDIPPELAYQLGAKSLQERRLEPYSSSFGEKFGQNERLTDRLANILRGYPCGPEILKELVQNADDAQATEIHFIHDKRVLPHERVFLKNAHEIQGPALCVYNNRPFTDYDLDAIQKLGVGGKRDDPLTTGQYGIGFNTVYNLTDCPSILSNGDTLCFFDPECRYVPGATLVSPGRKFHPIDTKFESDNSDILSGYLGDYLKLKGGTVFRLPLRSKERAQESLIAKNDAIGGIEEIFPLFKSEARKMLMFLTHVKKISLSVINERGVLEQEYHVNASLDVQDESKRQYLTSLIAKYKDLPTSQVPWDSVMFQMTISDSDGDTEQWLIHQCYGVYCHGDRKIPDGRQSGLLPCGGIAALLSSSRTSREDHLAYCLLPLPAVVTGLPVHINGHFALDTARRSLWRDDLMVDGYFTRWNDFIKLSILAPGYALLISEAKAYIQHYKEDLNDETQVVPSTSNGNEEGDSVHEAHYSPSECNEERDLVDETQHFPSECSEERDLVDEAQYFLSECNEERDLADEAQYFPSECNEEGDLVHEAHYSPSECNEERDLVDETQHFPSECSEERDLVDEAQYFLSECNEERDLADEAQYSPSECNEEGDLVNETHYSPSECNEERDLVDEAQYFPRECNEEGDLVHETQYFPSECDEEGDLVHEARYFLSESKANEEGDSVDEAQYVPSECNEERDSVDEAQCFPSECNEERDLVQEAQYFPSENKSNEGDSVDDTLQFPSSRSEGNEGYLIDEAQSFNSSNEANGGVTWYHQLFPDLSEVKSDWKDLTLRFYDILGNMSEFKILPVINGQHTTRWVSSKVGFFMDDPENVVEEDLQELLLRIDYPLLLYSPMYIYCGFQEAIGSDASRLISPRNVLEFLGTPECTIETLPRELEDTKIRSVSSLKKLISYCKSEDEFYSMLNGLPLLLTADCRLRLFDINQPVYCSEFSDLFPRKTDVFLHPKMVDILRGYHENCECFPISRGYRKTKIESVVMHKLTVNAVAQFLPEVFPNYLRRTSRHETWEFRQTGVLSVEWFKRLWEFLQDEAKSESLEALGEWPIIPTTSGNLVTINNARTVFDFTETGTEGAREKEAREFLKAARCPCLNKAITLNETRSSVTSGIRRVTQKKPTSPRKFTERTIAVTDSYVAHPYKVLDVLHVLDYMQRMGTLGISDIADEDVFQILLFFQDEYRKSHNAILKTLPLYKAFDGCRTSLSSYRSYDVIPEDIPLAEIPKLQNHTRCLFLHSDALPELAKLYSGLGCQVTAPGIGTERSICKFYTKYILPNFHLFHRDSQIDFLTLIRNKVLPCLPKEDDFWKSMKEICCIPDHDGCLHRAQKFFSPKKEIFQIMLRDRPDSFPPMPFGEKKWLKLLGRIGLKKFADQSQFLEFCREVERSTEVDETQSEMLVRYFLDNHHLHQGGKRPDLDRSLQFLNNVSIIKFIAAESVGLPGLQDGNSNEGNARYVQFRDSVLWKQTDLVWPTSSSILPQWADPESRCLKLELKGYYYSEKLVNILGVLQEPTVGTVVTNLQNISTTLARRWPEGLPNTDVLTRVMNSIYKFLSSKCRGSEISTKCTDDCREIGRRLEDCSCVYMKQHGIFVTGRQLSFTVPGQDDVFKPFIYAVPQEYGCHAHFLERIGATEKMSLDQVVNILKEIKNQCEDETIANDHKNLTKTCMHILFALIVDNDWEIGEAMFTELFLPSQDDYLIRSNELVCKVPPHLADIPLSQHVLLPFYHCGLEIGRQSDYIEALPEPVRPKPLNTIVREELDPSSKNDTCTDGDDCASKQRLVNIIGSQEFQEGIMRLMMHQTPQADTDTLKEMASRFSCDNAFNSGGTIECMYNLKVRLVDIASESVMEGSSKEHDCYVVVNGDKTWTLYVKHGNTPFGLLSKCLNEIIDGRLDDTCLHALSDMLSCEVPEALSRRLDAHGIEKDFGNGFRVPKELKQDLEKLKTDKPNKSRLENDDQDGAFGSGGKSGSGRWGGGGSSGWGKLGGECTMRTEYLIDDTYYTTPDPTEAKRWMNQSSIELEAAQFLLSRSHFYALVCFLCHQIVEKSLKAALYAKQGLNGDQLHTHNVILLAQTLSNTTDALTTPVNQVAGYYLKTRYPNRQPGNLVPAEQFNEAQATQAVNAAESIMETIKSFYM